MKSVGWLPLITWLAIVPAWSAAGVDLVASPFQDPAAGDDVVVAVTGTELDGATSLDLAFAFDSAVMTPTGVFTTGYSHGAALSFSVARPGIVEVHLAKGTAFTGAGDLAWVMFHVAPGVTGGTATSLSWVQASLNAGTIPCGARNRTITIGSAPARVSLPRGAFKAHGGQLLVPILVTGLGGGSSFDLTLSFDPNVLTAVSVQKPPFAWCMSMTSNLSSPGTVRISLFGLCSLAGSGPLALIRFNVVGPNGSRTPLNLTRGSIDEADHASVLQDGLFNACGTGDADADGYSVCAGDCDDANAARHPGAVESCNGTDDDCDGLASDAIPPTGTPSLQVDGDHGDAFLSWPAVPQATAYDILRGDVSALHVQGVAASIDSCLGSRVTTGPVLDSRLPADGDGFWYLARAVNCGGAGTYDGGGTHQAAPRDPANPPASSCP